MSCFILLTTEARCDALPPFSTFRAQHLTQNTALHRTAHNQGLMKKNLIPDVITTGLYNLMHQISQSISNLGKLLSSNQLIILL